MITYATTDTVEEEEDFRMIKVQEDGVKTPFIAEDFGSDSHPLKNMTALMTDTGADGEMAVIGYIDVDKVAELGEKRLFSLTPDGELSAYVWLKNNGEVHLNGDVDNLVKYNALKQKCDALQNFIQGELTKIQSGITSAGGAYTPGVADFDISDSKVENVKCG